MTEAAVLAIVFFLFFLVGVAVGVVVVIAVSGRRAHKAQVRPVAPPPESWPYLSGPGPDEGGSDGPPWWHARSGD
jgi:hypothetical protein